MATINIATEFSRLPGPRWRDEGEFSGEKFRDEILEPRFKALAPNERLVVVLDGVKFTYPTSFLEESFGGLAREHGEDRVINAFDFVATEEPGLIDEIRRYIRDAKVVGNRRTRPTR